MSSVAKGINLDSLQRLRGHLKGTLAWNWLIENLKLLSKYSWKYSPKYSPGDIEALGRLKISYQ